MGQSTRRNFLKSATVLTLCVVGFKDVYALAGGKKGLVGSSNIPIRVNADLEAFLSAIFGVPVTIGKVNGLDALFIPGFDPIILGIQLNTVVITAAGKVISTIDNSELYGGPSGWAPLDVQEEFFLANGNLTHPNPYADPGLNNLNLTKVTQGPEGTEVINALSTMFTTLGVVAGVSEMASNVMKLEVAAKFNTAGSIFSLVGIAGNLYELSQDSSEMEKIEDGLQIIWGLVLLTPIGLPAAISGGILLAGWELWEASRK